MLRCRACVRALCCVAGAAASGGGEWIQFTFVSPSGRLCVVVSVCVSARACVCVSKTTQKTSCGTLEISVANLKLKYEERSLFLSAVSCEWRGDGRRVESGVESLVFTFLYTFLVSAPSSSLSLLCFLFAALFCCHFSGGFRISVFFFYFGIYKKPLIFGACTCRGEGPRPLRVLDLLFMLWRNNAAVEQEHIANQAYAA